MSYIRTPEHRVMQAKLIQQWKPWLNSTGPKTPDGKAKISKNAYKGNVRGLLRKVAAHLREHRKMMADDIATLN